MALLSGRKRAYSYRHVERFLSEVAQADGAEALTDALAAWTTRLWKPAAEDNVPTVPVFSLPGRVTEEKHAVQVELRRFNDRQLNRVLSVVCERVTAAQPSLPDGRRLCLTIAETGCQRIRWSRVQSSVNP